LTAQIAGVDRRIRVRTETLARRFDRVLGVLTELGYVEGWRLTDKGRRLTQASTAAAPAMPRSSTPTAARSSSASSPRTTEWRPSEWCATGPVMGVA